MSPPWVIVAPGFHRRGGMEKANLELAAYLVGRGTRVHLVGHSIDGDLSANPLVHSHIVPRFGGALLSDWRLAREGKSVIGRVRAIEAGTRVVVNGGNCPSDDVNWVHYVHHAWEPRHDGAPLWYRLKSRIESRSARADERRIIPRASLVICNSRLTERHVVQLLGVSRSAVRTIYLGAESGWGEIDSESRARVRHEMGIQDPTPVALFVGALGYDMRKGFDTLFEAWRKLVKSGWDGVLIVAGGGRGLPGWLAKVSDHKLSSSIRLLGFSNRVSDLLAASDLLVSPTRYDSYGLNVQEALSRGLPAVVPQSAGVAEQYPETLRPLLLNNAESSDELAETLLLWRSEFDRWRLETAKFGESLREYGWSDMAEAMVREIEGHDRN